MRTPPRDGEAEPPPPPLPTLQQRRAPMSPRLSSGSINRSISHQDQHKNQAPHPHHERRQPRREVEQANRSQASATVVHEASMRRTDCCDTMQSSQRGGDGSSENLQPTIARVSSPVPHERPDPRCSDSSSHRGGGEKGKYMVMTVLSNALDLAKAAVAHDEQGALPEKVLPYYKKAIRAIDTALKLLPEHVAESTGIKRHRDNYQTRVDKLNQGLSRDNQQKHRRARQQSRVRFSRMELDLNHSTAEAEPVNPVRRSYWVMRLVRTTILSGGHLTPKLYAPKEVWTQVGVKVSGFAPRIAALESVLYMIIDRVKDVPKPQDAEARREAAQIMRAFREQAHKLQADLSRHFPHVVQVDTLSLAKELGPKSNLGRLNNVMKYIGRNVKNSAAVAVERIGAGIQGKHVDDGLVYYKQVVSELCAESQVFDTWFLHLQEQMARNDTKDMDELLMELHLVSSFMREVVCAIVLRDLEGLLDRYLRKMRKSFARMYWDEDYEDYEEEEDALP